MAAALPAMDKYTMRFCSTLAHSQQQRCALHPQMAAIPPAVDKNTMRFCSTLAHAVLVLPNLMVQYHLAGSGCKRGNCRTKPVHASGRICCLRCQGIGQPVGSVMDSIGSSWHLDSESHGLHAATQTCSRLTALIAAQIPNAACM